MNTYKLVSSNVNKLKEFQRFGLADLGLEQGKDIKEVDADALTVVLYKSLEAGKGRIVEDTSLHVEGEDVGVNIRWLLDSISNFDGKKAKWEVLLGMNTGDEILVYQGLIEGMITSKYAKEQKGFGFDAYFIPDGTNETLYDLEVNGVKDDYSARKLAIIHLQENESFHKANIADIPEWTGKMQ